MGYSTDFTGVLKFNQDILGRDIAYMQKIFGEDCRDHHEWREAYESLPFYDTENNYGGISGGGGLTYMDFEMNDDYDGIQWNGKEKTYDLVDKINLFIALMRVRIPDFGLEGILSAQGEEFDDRWQLFIDEDGWAKRRKLIPEGEVVTCPHCENRFIPSETIDSQFRY